MQKNKAQPLYQVTVKQGDSTAKVSLKAYLRQKRITQKALSETTGIPQPHISDFLNKNEQHLFSTVQKVLEAAGLQIVITEKIQSCDT